jgi:hypothetical protein
MAFLQLITTHTQENHSQAIPQQISSKRPHFSSGETIQPLSQKAKNQIHASSDHSASQPPPDAMEVEQAEQTQDDDHTATNSEVTDPFGGLQHPLLLNERPHVPDMAAYPNAETIPDEEYEFDITHSQPTRLEVRDALAVAKTISATTYNRTLEYIQTNRYIDIDYLQSLSKHRFPEKQSAHNESTARPTRIHHESPSKCALQTMPPPRVPILISTAQGLPKPNPTTPYHTTFSRTEQHS